MIEIEDKDKKKIDETAKSYSLDLILLFGSRAEDESKYIREDSDFDIAYLSQKSLNLMDEAKIAGELAKIFKSSNIDVVNIKRANPLLMTQIAP